MRFVEQQFFPNSDRPELLADFTLPQNASIAATEAEMDRFEAMLADDPDVEFWSSYVGRGAPRFILSYDTMDQASNLGQIVIQTPSTEARDRLRAKLKTVAARDFPGTDIYIKLLEIGPPVGRPVQYRISGPDINILRDHARNLAAVVASDTRTGSIVLDWNEPARVVRVDIVQDKARQLGLTSADIASGLNAIFAGRGITELRDSTYLIDIIARGNDDERASIEALYSLQLGGTGGDPIPLSSVAVFRFDTEQPVVNQRNRMPTITVKAAINTKDQPATVVTDLAVKIEAFRSTLPMGYEVVIGGTVESSAESQGPIAAVVPLMMLIMVTLVMIQMQGFRLSFVVLCAAPLGLIGVVAALALSGAPLGFVAILGVLALVGILIRNSIILVNEIEVLRRAGRTAWDAVFEASDSRARPILLTAAAASLALIPISRQIFWGPMAFAMMGGIIVGTLVTLVFVPALYVAVFRVKREATKTP
jgi:multidrug efflux pump subunit AcrB